jgi:hypothetical protein
MKTLLEKVKAGSLVTEEDLVAAIKWTIGRQPFKNFYDGLYDDYITGIAATPEEKKKISDKVTNEIILQFSPIFALLPRVNQKPNNEAVEFIKEHFGCGVKINERLTQGRIDLVCDRHRRFLPIN